MNKRKNQNSIHIKPGTNLITLNLEPHYKVNDTLVFQFIIVKEAGKYELTNFKLHRNLGYIQSWETDKNGFSLPFEIKNRKISYIGDIILNPKEYKQTGHMITLVDNSKRELKKIKIDFPNYDWSVFENNTIKSGFYDNKDLIKFK